MRWFALTALIALMVLPGGAAWADGGVSATGVQASPGQVEFLLTAGGQPSLARSKVAVIASGRALAATVGVVPESASDPNRAVVVVVRVSGGGAMLDAVRAAAARYAVTAPAGVAIGLVAVGAQPVTLLSPTTDRDAFVASLDQIDTSDAPAGLVGAVAQADALLSGADGAEQYRSKRIMAITAGLTADNHTVGSADDDTTGAADEVAQLVRDHRTVDAVSLAPQPRALALLAGGTGGRATTVGSTAALRGRLDAAVADLAGAVVVRAVVPVGLSGRSTQLKVSVRTGTGATLATSAAVRLAVDPGAVGAIPAPAPPAGSRALALLIGMVAVGSVIVWAGMRVLAPLVAQGEGRQAMGRLRQILEHPRGGRRPGRFSIRTLATTVTRWASHLLDNPARRARIELSLEKAGSSLTPDQWLALRGTIAFGVGLVLAVLLPFLVGLILGGILGWLGSGAHLRWRAGRRAKAFAEQLPDSLRVVVGSLRSGFSLHQAIDSVAGEGDGPVAVEFRRALAEIRLGGDLEDALIRVGERNDSRDMPWLVMAIRIQSEVGGSLAEVVETTVDTMRERSRLERHVRALSAEGRLSGIILLCMPIVVGGFMFIVRREYMRPLYTQPIGLIMLLAAGVLMVLGSVWLRKLVKVEV